MQPPASRPRSDPGLPPAPLRSKPWAGPRPASCAHQGATLFYDLFPNLLEMETYHNSRVREFGVTPGRAFRDRAERAENAYVRQRDGSEFEVGRLLRFRDGGSAVFIRTDRRVDISVEAQRNDPTNAQLYRQWADIEFGPLA